MKIKKVSEKIDYECPYFKINKEDFTLANGKKLSYYLLKRNSFVTVIVEDKGYTYLVEFYRFSIQGRSLEFPAGMIERNEKPVEAAKRELEEEAGIIAKKFIFLGWYYAFIGMADCKAHVYLAKDISFTKQKLDEAENGMKVRKVKISEIGNLIRKGKIKGEHVVNGYCLYLLNKKRS